MQKSTSSTSIYRQPMEEAMYKVRARFNDVLSTITACLKLTTAILTSNFARRSRPFIYIQVKAVLTLTLKNIEILTVKTAWKYKKCIYWYVSCVAANAAVAVMYAGIYRSEDLSSRRFEKGLILTVFRASFKALTVSILVSWGVLAWNVG